MAPIPDPPSFWEELRGRRVVRAVAVYAVAAWVVVQVADTFFSALRLPEWSVTLVAGLAVLGFPITVVLAWLFDRTPEGLQRTPSPSASRAGAHAGGSPLKDRRLLMAAALGAVLGLGLVGAGFWWGSASPSSDPAERPSVAVLPFEDFSPGRDQGYLADGITEDILSRIARSDDLRVLSRTTVMTYRDREAALPEIVAELGVTHVLEGSIQRSGDHIRITVQLIDASDAHLWTRSWTGPLDDVFAMQDEIAEGVADALAVELGPHGGSGQGTTREAYELHLRAREVEGRRFASIEEAIAVMAEALRLNERAIAIDPGFAPAWASAAEHAAYLLRPDSAIVLAREAIRLDPSSDRGHTVLGHALARQERVDAAVEQFRVATSINPNSPDAWYGLAAALDANGKVPLETWRALRRGSELGQAESYSGSIAALTLFRFLQSLGLYVESAAALRWIEEHRRQPGELQCYLAENELLRGDTTSALRHLDRMLAHTGRGSLGLWCDGRVRFLLGDRTGGLASMREAAAEEDSDLYRVWVDLMEASIAGPPAEDAHARISAAIAELSEQQGFNQEGLDRLKVLSAATAGDVEETVAGLRAFTERYGHRGDWRLELEALAPSAAADPSVTDLLDEYDRRLAEVARKVAADLEASPLSGPWRRYISEERARRAKEEAAPEG